MPRRNYNRNYNQYDNQRSDYGRGEGRSNDYGSRRQGRGYNRGNYDDYENEGSYSGGYPSDFSSDTGESYFGGSKRYGEGNSGGESYGGFSGSSMSDRNYGGSSDYDRDNENYNRGSYRRGGSYGQQSSNFGQGYNQDYDRQNYGSARSDYGDRAYGGRLNNQGMEDDRGWIDKASDEVSSWFGDDDAERRREMDRQSHRGKGPKNYTRSDDRIKEDVNDRLSDSHYLDASNIEVSVDSGEVTLSGTVDSRYAKRQAEDLADSVSGVNHTQNNLRVSQSSSSLGNQSTTGTDTDTVSPTTTNSLTTGKTSNNKSKTASS